MAYENKERLMFLSAFAYRILSGDHILILQKEIRYTFIIYIDYIMFSSKTAPSSKSPCAYRKKLNDLDVNLITSQNVGKYKI